MHIPNAVLDPKVALTTGAIGLVGLQYGLRSLEKTLGELTTVKMGIMAAFVFAAQMVNFPLGVIPASGHLIGGVLAAVMLGPWAGAVVIAAVLIVQCVLFGDGGLTALGANFVNMGLIGSVGGYTVYTAIRRAVGGSTGVILGAMLAAWLSVILAAGAFSVELAASGRRQDFLRVLSLMTMVHAVIGVGEALITGLVLRFILLSRPDLVDGVGPADATQGRRPAHDWVRVGAAGLTVAIAVGIFLAPFASTADDGLEYAGGVSNLGFLPSEESQASLLPALIPDYRLPGLDRISLKGATAAAGAVGTLVVFGFGVGISLAVRRTTNRRLGLDLAGASAPGASDAT